jgi:ABC-type multidrug transport system fused ATPase/permease subunit
MQCDVTRLLHKRLQDPVMFTGTLLDNLDPFRERSEGEVREQNRLFRAILSYHPKH